MYRISLDSEHKQYNGGWLHRKQITVKKSEKVGHFVGLLAKK